MKHFEKTFNSGHTKDCWNYVASHFNYCGKIANNVKVYNLPFKHNKEKILRALENDDYFHLNTFIEEWENKYGGKYQVGFEGRSGGYLTILRKTSEGYITHQLVEEFDDIFDWDNYECFKRYIKDNGENIKDYASVIRDCAETIWDFDVLCDDLIDVCDNLVDATEENEEEIDLEKVDKEQDYCDYEDYDVEEDSDEECFGCDTCPCEGDCVTCTHCLCDQTDEKDKEFKDDKYQNNLKELYNDLMKLSSDLLDLSKNLLNR